MAVSARHVLAVTDATGYAGAEAALAHLVAHLDGSHRVTVLGSDASVVAKVASVRPGTDTVVLPVRPGRVRAADIRRHRTVIRGLSPDVVHVNLRSPAACRAALAAAATLPGLAVVAVDHLPVRIPTAAGRALDRVLARRVDAYVAVGRRSARQVEQVHGLPPGSVRVVPNGVPSAEQRVSSRRPHDPPVLVTAARLDPQKGLDVLLHAMTALPTARLVVAGDGPQRADLQRLAVRLGLHGRVRFAGWVDDVPRLLGGADAFVLPSRHEGLPLALLEAMASGCPVVATGVGSVDDVLLDGYTGLRVPTDDPAAVAAAVQRVLDDPGLAGRLAANAAALACRAFGARRMAADYEALYEQLYAQSWRERADRGALLSRLRSSARRWCR